MKPVTRGVRPHAEHVAAVRETARLLSDLGHDVREVDPHYPDPTAAFVPQFFAGIRTEADAGRALRPARAAYPRDLPAGRLGDAPGDRLRAAGRPRSVSAKANRIFDDVDVLLTPTIAHRPPARRRPRRGRHGRAPRCGRCRDRVRRALERRRQPRLPACPCGTAADGLPLAVQLVGRTDGEETLLSLSAQLEPARPWPLLAGDA